MAPPSPSFAPARDASEARPSTVSSDPLSGSSQVGASLPNGSLCPGPTTGRRMTWRRGLRAHHLRVSWNTQ
eukprot:2323649-Prorocentrum_lima.AAC.1